MMGGMAISRDFWRGTGAGIPMKMLAVVICAVAIVAISLSAQQIYQARRDYVPPHPTVPLLKSERRLLDNAP